METWKENSVYTTRIALQKLKKQMVLVFIPYTFVIMSSQKF